MLWKHSRFGRIGYVSKGPVLPEETAPAKDAALARIGEVARSLNLAAVVVQPPDDSRIEIVELARHGFLPQPIGSVARATGIIRLDGGADGVVGRMSSKARQSWRNARRQDVTLSWGTRHDLQEFFRLMCETCKRQNEHPNPGRVALLDTLWDAIPGRVRVAFAEHGGRKRAGLLMIAQQDRIVLWKKGWDSASPHLYMNHYLMTECLLWASAEGFESADVGSLSPRIAARLLAKEVLVEDERRSRDAFNLRFGARPKLLPPAQLLVVNPMVRRIVYAGCRWPWLRHALEKRVG